MPEPKVPTPTSNHRDPDLDLSTSLLSPSKARLAAAQSTSWKTVDARLTTLFHPGPTPPFERNPATLSALLSLLQANESADAARRIVHDALLEEEAFQGASSSRDSSVAVELNGNVRVNLNSGDDFLSTLTSALPPAGQKASDDLAASAVLLGCHSDSHSQTQTDTSIESEMSALITSLTSSIFDAENQLSRLQQTSRAFSRDEAQLQDKRAQLVASTDPDVLGVESMQARTLEMNRESKVVGMKLGEYQERIKALRGYDVGPVKIEDVVRREESVRELQISIQGLEGRITEMQGLPPDLDVSRREVDRARGELEEWKRRREGAFEGLVE